MRTRILTIVTLGAIALIATSTRASTIDVFEQGLIRANGQAPRDFTAVEEFDAAVDAVVPFGFQAVSTPLSDLISGEGLLGGPAAGAFFLGDTAGLPSGMWFSGVDGDAPINSGLPGSTAVFADLQGSVAGTPNIYYLGDPAYGATEANRVQFAATDIGTNADNMMVLRPVSFDDDGEAIEVTANEKGVLEAGSFRLHFDASLGVYGMKLTFIDTESDAGGVTGVFNIDVAEQRVADTFAVPAGQNDNECFVGFFGSDPITSFDVHLGKINGSQTGGDGVLLDLSRIELIQVPEPGGLWLLVVAGLSVIRKSRRR
ncbi:MAG: hypothetical protein JXQ75_22525 [Phycisphaerae bacterium]|nr:hypothetical protein [Phycisphaerae bacterium]